MEILPILSTLRRHRTAAGLIVVEIAIATAIVCNALHLIADRIALVRSDSGLPEAELIDVELRYTGGARDEADVSAQDLRAIRALPGVRSAAVVNQVIYGDNSNNSDVGLAPDKSGVRVSAAQYEAGEQGLQTLGLKLLAGRDFLPEEYRAEAVVSATDQPEVPAVILDRRLADRLWPGEAAPLGRIVYVYGRQPSRVVGIVQMLPHPYPGRAENEHNGGLLAPVRNTFRSGNYLVRVADPARRDEVLRALPHVIDTVDSSRILRAVKPLTEMRADYYAQDRSMVWLMGGVCIALLVVTAFGIVGLASFWVQQRARMIGTRRALGATRAQIRHYFQLENFLITSVGVTIGMTLAYGGSVLLMREYELPRLPWAWLPAGAVALWALGQLAVLGPARRAAALPPVQAMRNL
ncbi:MAG TPA: FtsX-like permease family protein [Burkholderiaceae bacterium]|jgi:putative ABC transport system permease protein|nr:FtsX-like permease family protein [Burkholderiaceae bacterium]